MILYFADRQLNILGQASTSLPGGLTIAADKKEQDVETGVSVFECTLNFNAETRELIEKQFAVVGNYILRSHEDENELYQIIESEINTGAGEAWMYAEDAGMDLLNDMFGDYEADKAYPISHYVQMFAGQAGFKIGVNQIPKLTRKLSWTGEATGTERLASVATQFDGAEISYSYTVKGLSVVGRYINIYKKRGQDIGVTLRLNGEIDSITTTKSIANISTALICTGGTPDSVEDPETGEMIEQPPITLKGYKYDDGDFYVDGTALKSRKALKKWNRYLWRTDSAAKAGGHITRPYSFDTLSQSELCKMAIAELKRLRETEINYDADIKVFPKNVKIGDRVNIVDDAGGLYVSTRVLRLRVSVTDQEHYATLGENLIKNAGISEKVAALAAQFAKASQSAARALQIANNAKASATAAQESAEAAAQEAENAKAAADEAEAAAGTATQTAQAAQEAANKAQTDVGKVEEDVAGLEQTVANAQAAAEQAQQAAQTAETKATEAQTAANNAAAKADAAEQAAGEAGEKADAAGVKADAATQTAGQAKTEAEQAATTAAAAKLDAENAQKEIDSLGDDLTTLSNTMSADYARKTDLTEATASLQTQITQNAAEISSTASRVQEIDETANNAADQAAAAQSTATAAQQKADAATADAQAAQTAADNAAAAASSAQTEADAAKAAAETAQSVADKAEEDLEAAKADLATVQGRVDATEEEIEAAKTAVNAAQAAADAAQANAQTATEKANTAQSAADGAATAAQNAQTKANEAANAAALAQQTADAAKGDAQAAQQAADEAAATAAEAQRTANTAVNNAATAQSKADQAAADAAAAQSAADDADAKAAQAAADLATAQQNLADVTSRVGATEEEVEAAQKAVETAQAAADKAKEDAAAAQSTADTAKANAETAQAAADTAKSAADQAQADADAAQKAADDAQAAVDALAVRVTTAETKIEQNAEQIALRATKTEVAQTLGGYYTKEEADAAISVKADEINLSVDGKIDEIEIGGRNLLLKTRDFLVTGNRWTGWLNHADYVIAEDDDGFNSVSVSASDLSSPLYLSFYSPVVRAETGDVYTFSCWFKVDDVDALDNRKVYIFETFTEDGNRVAWDDCSLDRSLTEELTEGKWVKLVSRHTVSYVGENLNCGMRLCLFQNGSIHFKKCKLEIGHKATDWTPAPEDVDADIEDSAVAISQTFSSQMTQFSQTRDEILLQALSEYTQTGDFEAFKSSTEAQLSLLSDQMTVKFSEQQAALEAQNAELQDQINKITLYFRVDIDGATIGREESPYTVRIDDDEIVISSHAGEVQRFDATGKGIVPALQVTQTFESLGYIEYKDSAGNVNCAYVGGDS